MAASTAKTVLTGVALAATAYARMLGKKIELASSQDPQDAEEAAASFDAGKAEPHLSSAQGDVPAVTGGLLILNALHGSSSVPTSRRKACGAAPTPCPRTCPPATTGTTCGAEA
ncbi:hypothetical protein [Streptomyces sp. NPDC054849]